MTGGRLRGEGGPLTGADQSIRLGVGLAFAAEGAAPVVTGRNWQRLVHAVDTIAARGETLRSSLVMLPGENADAAVALAAKEFGGLGILVNDAQVRRSGVAFEEINKADIARFTCKWPLR